MIASRMLPLVGIMSILNFSDLINCMNWQDNEDIRAEDLTPLALGFDDANSPFFQTTPEPPVEIAPHQINHSNQTSWQNTPQSLHSNPLIVENVSNSLQVHFDDTLSQPPHELNNTASGVVRGVVNDVSSANNNNRTSHEGRNTHQAFVNISTQNATPVKQEVTWENVKHIIQTAATPAALQQQSTLLPTNVQRVIVNNNNDNNNKLTNINATSRTAVVNPIINTNSNNSSNRNHQGTVNLVYQSPVSLNTTTQIPVGTTTIVTGINIG